jgi:hypothetical protein
MPIEEFPVVAAMETRHPTHTSLLYQRPDGARIPIVATSIPLIGQGGELLGAVAVFWEDAQP